MNDGNFAKPDDQLRLRQQLQAQRWQIERRINPAAGHGGKFPKSRTLQWLMGPSTLSRRLVFSLVILGWRRVQANHRS